MGSGRLVALLSMSHLDDMGIKAGCQTTDFFPEPTGENIRRWVYARGQMRKKGQGVAPRKLVMTWGVRRHDTAVYLHL